MLKAQIVGNLGAEPEMKYSAQGQPILTFRVASNHRVKNSMGNWDDATEWVRVTVFGARAETLSQHLHKGMRVYVDGRLEARPWLTRDGSPMAGLEVVANEVDFMSSREDGQSSATQTRHPATVGNARGQAVDDDQIPF